MKLTSAFLCMVCGLILVVSACAPGLEPTQTQEVTKIPEPTLLPTPTAVTTPTQQSTLPKLYDYDLSAEGVIHPENAAQVRQIGHISLGRFFDVVFSPNSSDYLILASTAGIMKLSTSGLEEIGIIYPHSKTYALADSTDGKMIASGGPSGKLYLWDADSGELLHKLEGHTDSVVSLAFSPDKQTLISGGYDGLVCVWDIHTGDKLAELSEHAEWIAGVAYAPDGQSFASGSADGTLRLWDAQTRSEKTVIEGSLQSIAFSPDSKWIVTGGNDGLVSIWDVNSGKLSRDLEGHSGPVLSVAFSPDGMGVVTGSVDGTVRVWNAKTGELIRTLPSQSDAVVNAVQYSPDGTFIASTADDRSLHLFGTHRPEPNWVCWRKETRICFTMPSFLQTSSIWQLAAQISNRLSGRT